MKASIPIKVGAHALSIALVFFISANAQEAKTLDLQQLRAYNVSREVQLVGTVTKFDPASSIPPIGAHILVQTTSGAVDVHLGNAKMLEANHLTLNAGDNVRVIGEPLALGNSTFFAARIVQKGAQAVVLRNPKGFLISPGTSPSPDQAEALRGVR
jgi:hypothetical protein